MRLFAKSRPASFCPKCGKATIAMRLHRSYDRYTGEQKLSPEYVMCPTHVDEPYSNHYSNEPDDASRNW